MTTAVTPSPILEWLDTLEEDAANAFSKSLEDDRTLRSLAEAWRGSFSAFAATPAGIRFQDPTPQCLSRAKGPGALGEEYPTALFAQLKTAWSAAIGGLAFAESCSPFGWQRAAEASSLSVALANAAPPEIAPTASEVIHTTEDTKLRRYVTPGASGPPLLVVSPLINRWYVLDLLEGRSFMEMLVTLGRPVYLLEWRAPEGGPDDRGLGELCSGPLADSIERVLAAEEAEQVGLIGYCQGGTLASMFTARFGERVERLATVGAPVRFADGGLFRRWFDPDLLDVDLVSRSRDRISAWLVHLPFWWLRPTIKTRKLTGLVRGFRKPGLLEQFLAAEIWSSDNMDMTRGVFKSWCGDLYQRDALIGGHMQVAGQPVRLDAIQCPVLVVTGEYDAITPTPAAEALLELSSPSWSKACRVRNGHVGMLTSPRALESQREAFASWLEASE